MKRKNIAKICVVAICGVIVSGTYFNSHKKSYKVADKQTAQMLDTVAEKKAKEVEGKEQVADNQEQVEESKDEVQEPKNENELLTLTEAKAKGRVGLDIIELTEELTHFEKVTYPIVWVGTENEYGVIYDLTLRNNEEIWVTTNDYQGKYGSETTYIPPKIKFTDTETNNSIQFARTSLDENNVIQIPQEVSNVNGLIGYFYYTDESFNYNDYDTVSIANQNGKWAEFPISQFIEN